MIGKSETVGKLADALAKAQGEMTGAIKDSKNPFFKSSYADLASVWDACRGPLSKYGLSVVQTTDECPAAGIRVCTTILHASGEWIQSALPIMAVKKDPQGIGSAITYARRYALAALVGVAQVDDDGEAAHGREGGYKKPPEAGDPGQPGPEDGAPQKSPLGYIIPFGKYNKRGLDEIHFEDLRNYVEYIQNKAEKDKKPITGQVLDFVQRATAHIAAFETQVPWNEPGSEG